MTDSGTAEELLQFLYLMPVAVVKFRADGMVDLINPMAAQLLMPLAPAPVLDDIYTVLAPLVPDLRRQVAVFAADAGTIIDQQRLEANVGGKTQVLSLTVSRVKHDTYMAVLKDVTKLTEQERKLFADHQKFRAIFDHVRDYAIYTITTDGIVEEWNPSLQRYAGWLAGRRRSGPQREHFLPAGRSKFAAHRRAPVRGEANWIGGNRGVAPEARRNAAVGEHRHHRPAG